MKVAIAGYGAEGRASYAYWNTPGNDVTIVDERDELDTVPADAATILGEGVFSTLDGFDLVVRTAGLPPRNITTNGKIWSATNEFFAKCPAPIIGVTGTKGKGTTCSLIASILRAAGEKVHLVGNIGTPALDVVDDIEKDDIVVYELSSFQLWDAERSPHISVLLMIEPDHLDVHADMNDYIAAKANITTFQAKDDVLIFNVDNTIASAIASKSPAGMTLPYPFAIPEFVDSLVLPGRHNVENASAAIAASRQCGVDDEAIREGLTRFTGLPHRLRFVAIKKGVAYYDDSIATTPGSAIAAIRSFDQPKILILGGHDKGSDNHELLLECHRAQAKVIAIGASRQTMSELCDKYDVACRVEPGSMSDIVCRASQESTPGSVVLLSPAAASFDMFKNYSDRGDQFVDAVHALANE